MHSVFVITSTHSHKHLSMDLSVKPFAFTHPSMNASSLAHIHTTFNQLQSYIYQFIQCDMYSYNHQPVIRQCMKCGIHSYNLQPVIHLSIHPVYIHKPSTNYPSIHPAWYTFIQPSTSSSIHQPSTSYPSIH